MPSKSSGRIAKVRKNKYSTPHEKNHRWQSFNDKIAQFNSLQPLRRVRRHDLDTEDLSAATSYFQTALQKWNELNIGRCFVSFKQKVLPLSESLPQILHFETRIMDLLEEHIAMQDKDGLEPLLDLLTAFAHDLGSRFEKYYERSLALIIASAGVRFPDIVEMFNVFLLAWMYLTPIIYPEDIVPAWLKEFFIFNPMYHLIKLFREPIFDGQSLDPSVLGTSVLISVITLVAGWIIFSRMTDEIAYRS